jgi:hypothetical protein
LQPSAPMSMVRTSSRPASATLKEPVNVSTMISRKELQRCVRAVRASVW